MRTREVARLADRHYILWSIGLAFAAGLLIAVTAFCFAYLLAQVP